MTPDGETPMDLIKELVTCSEWNFKHQMRISELESSLSEARKEIEALRVQHKAWTDVFGTTQLTHAQAKLEAEKALADRLATSLRTVDAWFERMKKDQHEKLVEGQTLETASENWDKLLQEPLEMEPIKKQLAAYDAHRGKAST